MEKLEINSVENIISKMDNFLRVSHLERYGRIIDGFPINLVSDIIETEKVKNLTSELKIKISHIAFAYLVQMELGSVSSGFSNRILYNDQYREIESWKSPVFRLREGALR